MKSKLRFLEQKTYFPLPPSLQDTHSCRFGHSCTSRIVLVCQLAYGGMIGERCAERPGSGMLLWQHEFYFVIEKYNGGPPRPYIYQEVDSGKVVSCQKLKRRTCRESNCVRRGF